MSKISSEPHSPRAIDGLPIALLLGLALLLLSYLRIAGLLRTDAFHSTRVVAETLVDPIWRTRLGFNILLFVLAQLALHLGFGILCWLLALASERAWPRAKPSRRQWVLLWFLLGALWVLAANASWYPRSSLGAPYQTIGHIRLLGLPLQGLIGSGIVIAATATLTLALLHTLGARRLVMLVSGATVLVAAMGFLPHVSTAPASHPGRPNIILLGIDSLRPDLATRENAPHTRAFLDGSLELTDAITPLARTFPSWVSILTGRHPHTTGAFMNLLPPERIHTGRTLPALLREQGYRTVYAIDETRFSNIDTSYGFDQAITPGIGGSDFVLTWFSDTPLSNVVINTRLGALLFPFQHANRAAFVTYEPDTFVRRLDRALDARQPLFLALHLTLPHWPFVWADPALAPLEERDARRWKYLNTVRRADQQFGDVLAVLERKGLLANAVVLALSDHGETFSEDPNFLAQAFPDTESAALESQRNGHGTSVFSPGQFHTVLGFRAYGAGAALLPAPRRLDTPVSMLDIAPTILDLLHLPAGEPLDGQSLLPLFRSDQAAATRFAERIRYTESEYNPSGFNVEKMTASAIAAAAMIYRVDPQTDRLKVRPDAIDAILSTRQYAAQLGNSMAAAVPAGNDDHLYRFIYIPARGPSPDGHDDPKERTRLRQALEQRFKLRFREEAAEIKH
jgi:arylsulfatase A-like enzyme